jgi:hypothetical protein
MYLLINLEILKDLKSAKSIAIRLSTIENTSKSFWYFLTYVVNYLKDEYLIEFDNETSDGQNKSKT